MPLLAEILLRDLKLHSLVGLVQPGEERRYRLLCLKIDGPVFDLHDYIRSKLSVQRMKNIVGGARAIGFHVVVVEMVVVDEGAIEHHAAVRSKSVGQDICGVGRAAAIARRTGLPL